MNMKPKKSTLTPFGILYKRYTDIEKSSSLENVYKTLYNAVNKYWIFDKESMEFVQLVNDEETSTTPPIVVDNTKVYGYKGQAYQFVGGIWTKVSSSYSLNLKFADIGKYQMNRYYYGGTFSFCYSGDVEGTLTQSIKGLIAPLSVRTIQTYCDDIDIEVEDFVVLESKLYSIESINTSVKRMPKEFKIYTLTLNSIL